MFNWYEVKVEQKIAQERYQVIVEGRRAQKCSPASPGIVDAFINWTGARMVRLGRRLQQNNVGQRQSVKGAC